MNASTGIVLAIVLLCVFFFLLNIYDSYQLRKLRKKYNLNDDNSKKGEPPGRVRSITTAEPPTAGVTVAHQRELLQATEAIPTEEADFSNGKDSSLTRGFFKRFRK